jgi:hypothetical protein
MPYARLNLGAHHCVMNTRHHSLADAIAAERAKTLQIRDVLDVPDLAVLQAFFDSGPAQLTAAGAPLRRPNVDQFYADTTPMGL